ncbi:MAG: hypothetical protein PWP28_1416 [Oceanotoga sp.]|uniref:rubrerythrin family protein n=1 Tax=Oceanotoga sp. TaxID=2108366 RepID=UPI00264D637E|nr:rubrerythrin family protein [Oceanotoga sp.]MDN5342541.1 hypothetical protein [Oceanotoga sp.]
MSTNQNLIRAFFIESKNMNLFDYFSSRAKKDGYISIENIFQEFSFHERSHAKNFLRLINTSDTLENFNYNHIPIASTLENLKMMIDEKEKIIDLYLKYSKIADEEKNQKACVKFKTIAKAHEYHIKVLKELVENIINQEFFSSSEKIFWKCLKCGYIYEGTNPPEICPACGHDKSYFVKIK